MEEEYHDEDLEKLLSEALGSKFLEPKTSSPFAFGDTKLLAHLQESLKGKVPSADIPMILDDLRDKMLKDTNLGTVKGIHNTTLNCRRCPALASPAVLPSWNVSDPDVVFVLENVQQGKATYDQLVELLKDTGFTSRRCALTFLARCTRKDKSYQYSAEEFSNCNDYLLAELQLWSPKIIVLLGGTAHASFFGFSHSLNLARGKVQWLGPWAFLTTYSPAYAKKAGDKQLNEVKADLLMAYAFAYGDKDEGSNDGLRSPSGSKPEDYESPI